MSFCISTRDFDVGVHFQQRKDFLPTSAEHTNNELAGWRADLTEREPWS